MGYASAAASSGAAASERLDAHSAVGTAVALGALRSARAIRIELEKRGRAGGGAGVGKEM